MILRQLSSIFPSSLFVKSEARGASLDPDLFFFLFFFTGAQRPKSNQTRSNNSSLFRRRGNPQREIRDGLKTERGGALLREKKRKRECKILVLFEFSGFFFCEFEFSSLLSRSRQRFHCSPCQRLSTNRRRRNNSGCCWRRSGSGSRGSGGRGSDEKKLLLLPPSFVFDDDDDDGGLFSSSSSFRLLLRDSVVVFRGALRLHEPSVPALLSQSPAVVAGRVARVLDDVLCFVFCIPKEGEEEVEMKKKTRCPSLSLSLVNPLSLFLRPLSSVALSLSLSLLLSWPLSWAGRPRCPRAWRRGGAWKRRRGDDDGDDELQSTTRRRRSMLPPRPLWATPPSTQPPPSRTSR